jgi:branched-chain amino acid transport system permease protein
MSTIEKIRAADENRARAVIGFRDRWHALPTTAKWAIGFVAIALIAALPVLDPPLITTAPGSDFPTTMFTVAITVLAALGLNVVVGQAGLLDLGYVGFYAVGAYTVAVFGSPASSLAVKYPFLICVPIAIAISMLAGVILGGPTLRLRGDYLAIVTLGFGEIVRLTLVNLDWLGAASGISGVPRPPGKKADGLPLFGVLDAKPFYWLVLGVILAIVGITGLLTRSRVGRAWLAIREDEDAAELMGVPTFRFKLWAFAVGAAVGGLSGTLFASKQAFINPQSFPILTSVLFLAAVVVGGAGNTIGVVVGAVLIAYLPERFRFLAEYRVLAFGLALIVMSVFRPQGLIPSGRRATELKDRAQTKGAVNV